MSDVECEKEYDIYRDSLLRYAGYANEVGEAFRAQTAKYTYGGWNAPVSLTYAVAITYCAADAHDKCKSNHTSVSAYLEKSQKISPEIFSNYFLNFHNIDGRYCSINLEMLYMPTLDQKTGKLSGAMDAFAWQIMASVAIPGFTIHQVCKYSAMGLQRTMPKMPLPRR